MFKTSFICRNEQATVELAQALAARAVAGDVFALYGTLGMGKSVFARAFIQRLTGAEEVPSPTFTLVQTYEAPEFEIYHYDLYRLKSPDEIFELDIEEAMYQGVCLIEWPEKMGGYLPRKAIRITVAPQDNGRLISFEAAEDILRRLLPAEPSNV